MSSEENSEMANEKASEETTEKMSEVKTFSRISGPGKGAAMVETIVGCKWSLTVYQLLANDINRPGAMMRSVEGLSTKVLNQCLRKNVDFGILKKIAYPEIPPRVEYEVTPFGQKFMLIMDSLQALQSEIEVETNGEQEII
jgi:DNA-binding HxlR family transcriptional regulator